MTDKTQPLALMLAEQYDYGDPVAHSNTWKAAVCTELRSQHARIAELEARVQELGAMARENRSRRIVELEAQLEAIGAGGVQAISASPAGWKLVPVEPTKEMVAAACREHGYPGGSRAAYVLGYKSMLAASPTPPAKQQATKETSGGFHVWRDISTAPKDGSRFVATGHNYGLYSEVRHTCIAQWFRGCWMEASDWNETSELKYLTHWMPLPSPPDDVAAPAEQQAAPKAAPAQQEWRLVLPGGKYTDKWESARIGDYNRGWNDYRKAAIAALNSVVWPARTSGSWVGASTWLRNNYQDYPNIASLCDAMLEAAPKQEAQEPSRDAKTWCSYVAGMIGCYLNEPDESTKVQAISGIIERRLWALPTPQPAPAPLSDDAKDAARYRWLRNKSTVLHGTAWLGSATAYQRDVDFLRRDDALAALDAAIDAAIAAQKDTP